VITDVDTLGINIEVITVLRGSENRTNIRIWDGTDFDCNGIFSMAAADIGNVNDSLVIILPRIDSLENQWEILNDYRRPEPYTLTTSLRIINGFVQGFISGNTPWIASSYLSSFKYEDFILSLINEEGCDRITSVSKSNLDQIKVYPNPVNDILFIESDLAEVTSFQICGLNGTRVDAIINVEPNYPIDVSDLSPGIYAILTGKKELIKRFVKI